MSQYSPRPPPRLLEQRVTDGRRACLGGRGSTLIPWPGSCTPSRYAKAAVGRDGWPQRDQAAPSTGHIKPQPHQAKATPGCFPLPEGVSAAAQVATQQLSWSAPSLMPVLYFCCDLVSCSLSILPFHCSCSVSYLSAGVIQCSKLS